ncbi:MAG: STAS domain-containing protein [Actinomycetota bacterium]
MELVARLVMLDGQPVLHVSGEIDLATLPVFRDHLLRAVVEQPGATLVVDLDGVTALDDSGLGILLGAAARARETGGEVVVVCSHARLRERFALTRLDRAITVRSGLAER